MAAHLTTPRRLRLRRSLAAAALLIVGPGALAACSASGGDSGLSSSGSSGDRLDNQVPMPLAPTALPQSGTSESGGGTGGSKDSSAPAGGSTGFAPVSIATGDRHLIRTGQMGVEVGDLKAAAARARAFVAAQGGQISSESSVLRTDAEPDYYPGPMTGSFVQLVIALPPDALDASMDSLAELGDLVSRSQSAEDVTLQVVDLESRTATMRASIDRVRALMDRATSIADVVALESELARREADLESMTGQLQSLKTQSAMSTLVLTLSAGDAAAPADDDRHGALGALLDSLSALGDGVAAVVIGVAAALPFVALLAIIGGIAWLILRPRRRVALAGPVAANAPSDRPPAPVGEPAPTDD